MTVAEIEQLEIREFLGQCPPLDRLEPKTLDEIVEALEITYCRRGAKILHPGDSNDWLFLIRSGAVEIFDHDGSRYSHLEQGDWFGYRSLLQGGKVSMAAVASEDSLLYLVPAELFLSLRQRYAAINRYFSNRKPDRLKDALEAMRQPYSAPLIGSHARDLVHRQPLIVDCKTRIHEAAQMMKEKTVTAMLVMENGRLEGIVTDRAFCTKLAVKRMDFDQPVADIMTRNPITIEPETTGSEAMLVMARNNIRHLPVVSEGRVVGMLTATDLIRHQSHTPIYLINEVHRALDLEALKALSQQIPKTFVSLVQGSMSPNDIGHAMSAIGEAITQRLLYFARQQLGESPVPWVWVAAGSLARNEQLLHSDQDNALILGDGFVADEHDHWFQSLARFVSDGLNACGYVYCPGNVMATNPEWRQPLSVWKQYFDSWINQPERKALMYSSIFFDLRAIDGNTELLADLRKTVLAQSRGNTLFLAHMAANALQFHPPLGLFRRFVLEKGGAEEKALNLKKRGVTPVTDLARVYALAGGVSALNTRDRLINAAEVGELSRSGKADLLDAFEFISTVRLRQQAAQIERGEKADNFVPPETLSSLEKRHLKDAFEVVRTMQEALETRYQAGRLM